MKCGPEYKSLTMSMFWQCQVWSRISVSDCEHVVAVSSVEQNISPDSGHVVAVSSVVQDMSN